MPDGKPIRTIITSTTRRDIFRKAKAQLEKEYGEQLTDQQALEGLCVDYLLRRKKELSPGKT